MKSLRAVLFTGKDCRACPTMKLHLKKSGITYDEIDIGKKENAAIAAKLGIRSLPTFFLFDEAVPLKSFVGIVPMDQLLKIKHKYF